jgi:uncharacterized membrane protein YhaH (DUF805 family)
MHSVSGTIKLSTGETREFSNTSVTLWPWAAFVLSVLTAIPMAAIGVKRRHDRDFSGIDVIGFAALTTFMQFLYALGTPTGWFPVVVSVAVTVWGICLIILLGFLKGTPGPNKYGPAPLAATVVPAQ